MTAVRFWKKMRMEKITTWLTLGAKNLPSKWFWLKWSTLKILPTLHNFTEKFSGSPKPMDSKNTKINWKAPKIFIPLASGPAWPKLRSKVLLVGPLCCWRMNSADAKFVERSQFKNCFKQAENWESEIRREKKNVVLQVLHT